MGPGGHVDDASRASLLDQVKQQIGQQEMTQMVRCELHLEALLGLPVRTHHDARVVDEQVEPGERLGHLGRERSHRVQVSEVQVLDLDLAVVGRVHDGLGGHLGLLGVAAGHDDAGAALGKVESGLVADARVGASDDGQLAIQAVLALADGAGEVEPVQQEA